MLMKQNELERVLDILNENGALEHIILIGSWAEYLYKEKEILTNFKPNIRTLDIDFLIKNKNRPSKQINLPNIFKDENFIVEKDVISGVHRILGDELEVEFLIKKVGAGLENSIDTNIGITALSLRNLDLLEKNIIDVPFNGYYITIPKPEAYFLHKIIINEERGMKKEKDKNSISNLSSYIDINNLNKIYNQLTKKQRDKVISFYKKNNMKSFIK